MKRSIQCSRLMLVTLAVVGLVSGSRVSAQDAAASASDIAVAAAAGANAPKAVRAAAVVRQKDIVLDSPAMAPAAPALPPVKPSATPVHDAAMASALADMALAMLRFESNATGDAQRNFVVSSFSLASALAMIHAGAAGATAAEISAAVGSPATGERLYSSYLPSLIRSVQVQDALPRTIAIDSHVWVDSTVAAAIPEAYSRLLDERFRSEMSALAFAHAEAARATINAWVDEHTAHQIPTLMPEGSISPMTRLMVTNVIHFKSPWAKPFEPLMTEQRPFHVATGAAKAVPTMIDERSVRTAVVGNVKVIEIPFKSSQFALLIGMPPAGHTLNAFETDIKGVDLAAWTSQLKPQTCRLELPRFAIDSTSQHLTPMLKSLGIRRAFSAGADFAPMLGSAAQDVVLEGVFQSATVTINETGGEADAATSGLFKLMGAKSYKLSAPSCAVDRPFIFAIVHLPSGAPLFVGKIADPSLP